MCISPITKFDIRRHEISHVPCGKCFQCIRRKKLDWEIRLSRAASWSDCCFFCLLSFDEQHYPKDDHDHNYNHDILARFFSRLRKRLERNFSKDIKLKYYVASEYGEDKSRLHFHALFFIKGYKFSWLEFSSVLHDYYVFDRCTGTFFNQRVLPEYVIKNEKIRDKSRHLVDRYKISTPAWEEGFIGNVYSVKYDRKRLRYTLKYIQKQYNKSWFSRFSMKDILSPEECEDIINSFDENVPDSLPSISYCGKRVPVPYYWLTLLFNPNTLYKIRGHANYRDLYKSAELWLYESNRNLEKQLNFENTLN